MNKIVNLSELKKNKEIELIIEYANRPSGYWKTVFNTLIDENGVLIKTKIKGQNNEN